MNQLFEPIWSIGPDKHRIGFNICLYRGSDPISRSSHLSSTIEDTRPARMAFVDWTQGDLFPWVKCRLFSWPVKFNANRSHFFSLGNVINSCALIQRICGRADKISAWLCENLSSEARHRLECGHSTVMERQIALVEALNRVIQGEIIYDLDRFEGVALSPSTVQLLSSHPEGLDRIRANRMLLQEAYPIEITRTDGGSGARHFAIAPELRVSIVSYSIASYFGIDIKPIGYGAHRSVPLAQFAGIVAAPITSLWRSTCWLDFAGASSVFPRLDNIGPAELWISDTVAGDFAVLGRDVLNSMLVLYRGVAYDGLPSGARKPEVGRVYFGADGR